MKKLNFLLLATFITVIGFGQNAGDIVITEIMQNPIAVSDDNGEYFEVFNPTESDIDLEGWRISDNGTNNHTIVGALVVPAGGYLVLGRNTDTQTNGGAQIDYAYGSDIILSNSGDEIILTGANAVEIDRMEYDGGPVFPDPSGASMELSTTTLDAMANDIGANWEAAVSVFGDGDLGTPGTINDFTLSIGNFKADKYKIYPNPTSKGFINISGNNGTTMNITVFDVLGKQVINKKIDDNQLDVSGLNAGVYVIKDKIMLRILKN